MHIRRNQRSPATQGTQGSRKRILARLSFFCLFVPASFAPFAQEVPEPEGPERERISFWRYEQNQALGKNVVLVVPFDYRVALFRNRRPLQFHGWGGFLHRHVPDLSHGEALGRDLKDLTPLLQSKSGDYVLIGVPERAGMEIDFSREQYTLLSARIKGALYTVINISVTADGRISLEAEREDRYGEAGEYFHWDADSVFVLYRK